MLSVLVGAVFIAIGIGLAIAAVWFVIAGTGLIANVFRKR